MQQTRFDQWLRKRLLHINRVYCNTLPGSLPFGLKVEEAPDESGGRYMYKLSTRSAEMLDELATLLQDENITYTSRVEDRDVWYTRWLNNPFKSFTYRVAWMGIFISLAVFILSGAPVKIWDHLRKEKSEEIAEGIGEEKGPEATRIFYKGTGEYEIDRR